MIYDVLKESWIPAVSADGDIRYIGIYEALCHAEKYSAVRGENPLVTYGIQRLLIAFLQDALQPEDKNDLIDIISSGHFDALKLDEYFAACRKAYECFDLLDERHPFLQTAFASEDEAAHSPVTSLFLQWPSGNNHIHFNHQIESEMSAGPEECLRALCTLSAFQISYSRSKHYSVNGTPPRYFLFSGKNLFETLSCSMVSKTQIDNTAYDMPPPAWRDCVPIPNRQAPAKVSLLHGLSAQPLRIQLCMSDNGRISSIKTAYGYDYKEIKNWTDPHVAFMYRKDKERSLLLCKEGREVWRDMGTILRRDCCPMIMQHAEDILNCLPGNRTSMEYRTFSLTTVQKTAMLMPVGWEEEDLPLYKSLLSKPEQVDFLQSCLECMEDINNRLAWVVGRSMDQLQGKGGGNRDAKGPYRFLTAQVQTTFLSSVRQYLLEDFVPLIETQSMQQQDWDIVCRTEWGKRIVQFSMTAFQQTLSRMAQSAQLLHWRAMASNLLSASTTNIMKKGGFINNGKKQSNGLDRAIHQQAE